MGVALAPPLTGVPSRGGWELTVRSGDPRPEAGADLQALSEAALVEACLDGRAGAFDLIVERHRRTVYQVCYRFVNNHEDASDLSQEVFLRAFRGLRNFKGQSALATWLYRISVNLCLNRVSVKRPRSESIDEQQFVDTHTEAPHEQLLRQERSVLVREAVARLPKKQRSALMLRVFHDLSHREISEALGISVGAVKANVFHALQNLKKMLNQPGTA